MSSIPRKVSFLVLSLVVAADPAPAQDAGSWNSPRALELVARARERRTRPQVDSTLRDYQAAATGYIYYYLDRKDTGERTLVKVDQLALEVYWGAPDRTKQRIIGLRERKALPNDIQYHLDHLTVVQNEFDDRIHMGDGDEVRDVLHPAARGAEAVYDFRVADSLTLRLGGAPEPIRVYEIEARPKRPGSPAFVGSVFVDRATADIVRMTFTFTPESYVDPRLDYIHVSLDNGLWEGRYWLPYRQELEIRRQIPELDFPVGGVIRGVMRIGDYRFNQDLPATFFRGARVVAAPKRLREAYAFERDIFAELDTEGLSPVADLAGLRRQAAALIGRRHVSGLPRLRLYIPNASSVLRYNRAEGVYLGGGASYAAGTVTRIDASGGYATGPDRFGGSATARTELGDRTVLHLRGEWKHARDLGIRPGTAGLLNTLSAAVAGEDRLDPYFATGVAVRLERRLGREWHAGFELRHERHESARLEELYAALDHQAFFRPVRPVAEGVLDAARVTLGRPAPAEPASAWGAGLTLEAGAFEGAPYIRPVFEAEARLGSVNRRTVLLGRAAAGLVAGDAPAQRLFLVGGQGTLPGYPYRSFLGDRFALAELELGRQVIGPWIGVRALASAGWTRLSDAGVPAGWDAAPTDGIRASAGVGLGLFYDILRVDWARPLDGSGGWTTIVSVSPRLRDML